MTKSLKERFREVDRVPTPWDEIAADVETPRSSRPRIAAVGLVAASVVAVAIVAVTRQVDDGRGPLPDATWLLTTQGSCVEQYSPRALPNRAWAFEGVIAAVDPPADAANADPATSTTTVTFQVERWFWGGTGDGVSLRTYAVPSSAGALESSIGAHLLASGEDDFLWPCGFTKPFSRSALEEFEAAARRAEA
jgi:hypothetical protein